MRTRFKIIQAPTVMAKVILLLSLCPCVFVVPTISQDWKTVHAGVEYSEVTREISGLKVNMNLLRLDLTKVRLDVHHALDKAIGLEKTSSIATRHDAVAAINSGFFRLDSSKFAGDSAGVLIIDNRLLSESNKRIALLVKNDSSETKTLLTHLDVFPTVKVSKFPFGINGLNRERKNNELVLYTPKFGSTTLTDAGGLEYIVRKNRITAISGAGNCTIPSDGLVISTGKDWKPLASTDILTVGSRVEVTWYDAVPKEARLQFHIEDAVAGVPQLIKNGKIDITWEQEKTTKAFVETRHPRTAVAMLKDGKFLMITVDGRSESSGGIGLQDLADYLLSLGATDAMNLDGGGSTTMFLDGKVVNHPSDKEGERKVGDAILVTLRKNRK